MSREIAAETQPSVEDRLAKVKRTRDVQPGLDVEDGAAPRCKFEIEIPRHVWDKIGGDEKDVYSFLRNEGCDALMKAYLNVPTNLASPRGGELGIECKVNEKGEKECKAGIKIGF